MCHPNFKGEFSLSLFLEKIYHQFARGTLYKVQFAAVCVSLATGGWGSQPRPLSSFDQSWPHFPPTRTICSLQNKRRSYFYSRFYFPSASAARETWKPQPSSTLVFNFVLLESRLLFCFSNLILNLRIKLAKQRLACSWELTEFLLCLGEAAGFSGAGGVKRGNWPIAKLECLNAGSAEGLCLCACKGGSLQVREEKSSVNSSRRNPET